MSNLLEARGLEKVYQTRGETLQVLKGVDLSVERGEVLAIVGASGVGKSTLLHLLGALDRPTAGQLLYDGRDIFQMSDQELASFRSRQVGYVFQFYNLLTEFTALENAMLPALIQRRAQIEAKDLASAALRDVGLEGRTNHRPGELSGGEQQRVAIARALVGQPAVMLADEPTGNLDAKTSASIFDLFLRLRAERGLTVVVVTHNERLAERTDRIIRLVDGRGVSVNRRTFISSTHPV